MLRRGWRLIGACLVLAVAGGWLITDRMAPVYEAQSTLRIDDENAVPALEMLQTLGGTGKSEVATEMEVLRSRSLAREVVDLLGLRVALDRPSRTPRSAVVERAEVAADAPAAHYRFTRAAAGGYLVTDDSTGAEVGHAEAGGPVQLPGARVLLSAGAAELDQFTLAVAGRQAAIDDLLEALSVTRPNRDAAIVAVSYRGTDPALVRDVPNVLVESFVRRRLEVKKTGATSTVAFLRTQLDTIARQLRRAEDSLRAFRESAQIVSLETEAGAQVQNLAALQAQRQQVGSEYAALRAVVDEADLVAASPGAPSPYRKLLAFPTLIRNPAASDLLTTLNRLDTERGELRQRRTLEDPDVQLLDRTIADLEAQVQAVVETYLAGLREQVTALDGALAGFGRRLEAIPAREVQYARLQRQTTVLSEIHTLLQTRLKESEIAQAVEDPTVRPVDLAYLPELPVAPRTSLNLLLAGLLGLMLGGAAAFGREWVDTAVHTREDVQLATGVPVLGVIPQIAGAAAPKYRFRRGETAAHQRELASRSMALVAGREPQGVVAEAYRALRTNLTFAHPERPPKTIVFTSPAPGDGKSTSVANLATTLAQQGIRVLVIDADLRRGFLHHVLGGNRGPGLSEILIGQAAPAELIQDVTVESGARLHLIATGALPPNPAELLGSDRLRQLLERLDPLYDVILVDTPPVNVVTDAAVVGVQSDGVVLVARAGKTGRDELRVAMEQLRNVRVGVLGAVVNGVDARRESAYGGRYAYGRDAVA